MPRFALCFILVVDLTTYWNFLHVSADNVTEDNLIWSLMATYNMHARPTIVPVNATITFNLESISELDERNQELHVSAYMNVYWKDLRLQWSPDDWGGLTTITLPANMLWKPDFALINAAGDIYNKAFYSSYYLLEVDNDGAVSWFPHGEMAVRCVLDLTYYPFDKQLCYFRFENWVYQTNLCNIYPETDAVTLDEFIGSGEWNISNTSAIGFDNVYPDGTTYSDVYFYLTLQRKTSFYLMNSVFPVAVMSALMCLVFSLPAESAEKVALSITLLLAFIVLLVDVSNSMPKTSDYTPLLSRYITLVTAMSALSLLGSIYVIRLSHHGTKEVPQWVQRIVIKKIGRWLWIVTPKVKHEQPVHSTIQKTLKVHVIGGPDVTSQTLGKDEPNWKRKVDENLIEILEVLKDMRRHQSTISNEEHRRHTWMTVGLVVDRMLLCIFVSLTVLASIVIMTLMPEQNTLVRHT